MAILKRPERLKELPRFRDLSEEEMLQIAEAGRIVSVPAGWSMIWEGSPPDEVYLIVDGRVSVTSRGAQIAELEPGHIVGEIAQHEHVLRTATVTALTPLELLHLAPAAFHDLCASVPAFQRAVDATVEERLAERGSGPGTDPG